MQLPPTILSVDDKKKMKPVTKNSEKRTKIKSATQTKTPKEQTQPVVHALELNSDNSGSEDVLADKTSDLQLRGGSRSLVPPRTLETTLFDRLENMYGNDIKRMLDTQYR